MNLRRTLLIWTPILAVLGLVGASYMDPHTVVDLANKVWSCF